ncbi:TPA: allose kinase [Enterobacter asburiae]
MTNNWLGIDIGGTSTRLLIMNDAGEWSNFRKVPTSGWAVEDDAVDALYSLIAHSCSQVPVSGIMLGLPGILSRDRQYVISLPFIQALDNRPVAAELSEKLGIPVAMDKDVNHLMLWDLLQLPAMPVNATGLYLGTGMGNSLWLNGQFYHGQHGGSGELGHIPWADNQKPCPCGNSGCVETLTSGHWLKNWASDHFPETDISDVFRIHGHHPDLTAFIDRVSKVIASELNILDPEYLILGGGLLSMPDFPIESLQQKIITHLRPPVTRAGIKIVISHATDETGCRGACHAAQRRFRSK